MAVATSDGSTANRRTPLKPSIQFYSDAAFFNAACQPLTKNAASGVLEGLLSSVVDHAKSYFSSHIGEDKFVSITDMLVPGFFWALNLKWLAIIIKICESYFSLSPGTILESAWREIMPAAKSGSVSSSQVDAAVKSVLPSSADDHITSSGIANFKLVSMGSKQLVCIAAASTTATSLLGKIVGWIIKAVLASAGLLVVGDVVNQLTGHQDTKPSQSGLPTLSPQSESSQASTQTVLKPNSSYEPEHHNLTSSWMISVPPSQIGQVLTQWAMDIYPDLNGHQDIITSSPHFQQLVSLIQQENASHAAPYTFIPHAISDRKAAVDYFIDQVADKYQQLFPKKSASLESLAAGKSMVMYHGTNPDKLSTIASQGLIPYPKDKEWGTDPDAGWNAPSRVSFGGTYLTTNLMTALSSSRSPRDGVKRYGLIIVETIPNVLVPDEDEFTHMSHLKLESLNVNEYLAGQMYADYIANGSTGSFFQEGLHDYLKHNLQTIQYRAHTKPHQKLTERLTSLITEHFIDVLKRKVAYINESTWRRAWHQQNPNIQDIYDQAPPLPSKSDAEAGYARFIDKLTKAMKMLLHSPEGKESINFTARTLNPIGFSGSSKIVAALEISLDRKSPDKTHAVVKTVYPGSWASVPQSAQSDFISQWSSRMGYQLDFE
jgi:hypothetical protein